MYNLHKYIQYCVFKSCVVIVITVATDLPYMLLFRVLGAHQHTIFMFHIKGLKCDEIEYTRIY